MISIIDRYSGSHYRIETDLDLLVSKCLLSIEQSKNKSISSDSLSTVQNRQNRKKSWLSLLPSKKRKKQRVSSIKHKLHGNYSLSDIDLLDHELGMEIRILSLHFGYDIESRVKVNDPDKLNLIQSSQYDTLRSTLRSTLKSTFKSTFGSSKSSVPSPVSDTVQSHVQLHKCYWQAS